MNISQLRYFLKTAELLNYTQAAEALFITRQSLRQAIASMEEELGVPLFDITHNHLTLTGEGDYLRISAAKVIGGIRRNDFRYPASEFKPYLHTHCLFLFALSFYSAGYIRDARQDS